MPSPVTLQVLDLVAANANDSMVDCTIFGAGGNWGICASMLMMLQDDTKATFVKSTLVNVVRDGNLARGESGDQWALFCAPHAPCVSCCFLGELRMALAYNTPLQGICSA